MMKLTISNVLSMEVIAVHCIQAKPYAPPVNVFIQAPPVSVPGAQNRKNCAIAQKQFNKKPLHFGRFGEL